MNVIYCTQCTELGTEPQGQTMHTAYMYMYNGVSISDCAAYML